MSAILQKSWIERRIYLFRGMKVMLSADLAELYGVEPRSLVQAVKRNLERFPSDFMFQLNNQEFTNLKSQIVISSWGGIRTPPYAFTEMGIAMLSTVLNSPQAIQVNIEIMRIFVQLRSYVSSHKEVSEKLNKLEMNYDYQFKVVFDAIREIVNPPVSKRGKIGIGRDENE
ncbi:MAG: ORF6N domain-containing protein [Bdellovibrionia bacterium]